MQSKNWTMIFAADWYCKAVELGCIDICLEIVLLVALRIEESAKNYSAWRRMQSSKCADAQYNCERCSRALQGLKLSKTVGSSGQAVKDQALNLGARDLVSLTHCLSQDSRVFSAMDLDEPAKTLGDSARDLEIGAKNQLWLRHELSGTVRWMSRQS